jgi:hypothetical protein
VASKANDSAEIVRERGLADEFISVRLIDFVADAEAMLDETLLVIAAVDSRFRPSLAVVPDNKRGWRAVVAAGSQRFMTVESERELTAVQNRMMA